MKKSMVFFLVLFIVGGFVFANPNQTAALNILSNVPAGLMVRFTQEGGQEQTVNLTITETEDEAYGQFLDEVITGKRLEVLSVNDGWVLTAVTNNLEHSNGYSYITYDVVYHNGTNFAIGNSTLPGWSNNTWGITLNNFNYFETASAVASQTPQEGDYDGSIVFTIAVP